MKVKLSHSEVLNLKDNLDLLSKHRIYFGHMSVGENILNGLKDLYSKYTDTKLNLINLHEQKELSDTYFAHSYIGQNSCPESKYFDFSEMVNRLSPRLEIALMKLCFVDIVRESNVQEIFNQYRSMINNLKKKYPDLVFVHMTVPLISEKVTFKIKVKRIVKKLIGRRDYSPLDNIKRNEYNKLILDVYKDEPIYDIARLESTYPNESREVHQFEGVEYYSMIKDYTYDSGHLNERGSYLAALELVRILSNIIKNNNTIN